MNQTPYSGPDRRKPEYQFTQIDLQEYGRFTQEVTQMRRTLERLENQVQDLQKSLDAFVKAMDLLEARFSGGWRVVTILATAVAAVVSFIVWIWREVFPHG